MNISNDAIIDVTVDVEVIESKNCAKPHAIVCLKGREGTQDKFPIPSEGLRAGGRVELVERYLSMIGVKEIKDAKSKVKKGSYFSARSVVTVSYRRRVEGADLWSSKAA